MSDVDYLFDSDESENETDDKEFCPVCGKKHYNGASGICPSCINQEEE